MRSAKAGRGKARSTFTEVLWWNLGEFDANTLSEFHAVPRAVMGEEEEHQPRALTFFTPKHSAPQQRQRGSSLTKTKVTEDKRAVRMD